MAEGMDCAGPFPTRLRVVLKRKGGPDGTRPAKLRFPAQAVVLWLKHLKRNS